LQLHFLAKEWWHTANWLRAHPFSAKGIWASSGGDVDSTAPLVGSAVGTDLQFDVTQYFKNAISNQSVVHYGMLLSATGTTLNAMQLVSSQGVGTAVPKVVATYTGTCTSSFSSSNSELIHESVYQLRPNSIFTK